MWSFRDASMAQRKLDDAQALAVYEARLDGGPVMKAWDGNVGMSPQQKFEQNLATAYYAPVVAAGVGLAAYAGGSAFLAGQLAKVPATELGYSQLATGMGISGGVSALIYAGLNGGDSTPAGISIAFTGGAIGGGLVKPSMNFGAQLANTAIPLTWSNAMTQATGMAYGFGAAGWVNKAGLTVTGQSWWTQPVYPMPENSIKKP
jgi:hypothetical protein